MAVSKCPRGWRQIKAKFGSICPDCDKPIDPGMEIYWASGEKAIHIDCEVDGVIGLANKLKREKEKEKARDNRKEADERFADPKNDRKKTRAGTFRSKYSGNCGNCSRPYRANDHIGKDDATGRYVHAQCPVALPPIEGQTWDIYRGSGHGSVEFAVGQILKMSPGQVKQGYPEFGFVLRCWQDYVKEDGLSCGVGDEEGWLYGARIREATAAERRAKEENLEKARLEKEAKDKKEKEEKDRYAQIARIFHQGVEEAGLECCTAAAVGWAEVMPPRSTQIDLAAPTNHSYTRVFQVTLTSGGKGWRYDTRSFDDYRSYFYLPPRDAYVARMRAAQAMNLTPEIARNWLAKYQGCFGQDIYEAVLRTAEEVPEYEKPKPEAEIDELATRLFGPPEAPEAEEAVVEEYREDNDEDDEPDWDEGEPDDVLC